jgi:hypothetical protein
LQLLPSALGRAAALKAVLAVLRTAERQPSNVAMQQCIYCEWVAVHPASALFLSFTSQCVFVGIVETLIHLDKKMYILVHL